MLNFLGIGAQKAGTSWLYQQLVRHPQIAFPAGKEVHFWDRLSDAAQIPAYFSRFETPDRCVGEITPAYATLPRETIALLHRHAPELRLIYLIRNPIERAWSAAGMARRRAELSASEADKHWYQAHFHSTGSIARGDYAACLRNWLTRYPREHLLILPFEQISSDPAAVLRRCCEHLGVEAPTAAMLEHCHERVFAGEDEPLPAELWQDLQRLYRPRIRALERLLGQSFAHWLQPPARTGDAAKSKTSLWRRSARQMQASMPPHELVQAGLFDADEYLSANPDVAQADIDPLQHYLHFGVKEGRNPGAHFDTRWYLENNPDVAKSGINPLLHYWRFGMAEGRAPWPPQADAVAMPAPGSPAENEPPPRAYADFSSFLRQSIFNPRIEAPLQEADLRVIGHLRGAASWYAEQCKPEPARVSVAVRVTAIESLQACLQSLLGQTQALEEIVLFPEPDATLDSGELTGLLAKLANPCIRMAQSTAADWPAQARGDWLAVIDGECRWLPQTLAVLLAQAQAQAGCALAYAALAWQASDADELQGLQFAAFNRALLENRPYLPGDTCLYQRSALQATPAGSAEDWDSLLWHWQLMASQSQPACAIPALLAERCAPPRNPDPAAPPLTGERLKDLLPQHAVPGLELMHALPDSHAKADRRPVAVIIPSFECLDYLRLCMDAVLRFTPQPLQLIVVDNGSEQAVQDFLAAAAADDARISVIQNRSNLGFTYAVNQGIELAGDSADIVLLNNDAVVTPGWLEALQAVFEAVPEAGLAVSRQVLLPGTKTLQTHSPYCDPLREMDVNLSRHHDNLIKPGTPLQGGLSEISFAPFFCVYIPRRTLDELGPLDHENAPHYRSDRLYCEAVRCLAGRPILHAPQSKVYHFLQRATDHLRSDDKRLFQDMFVNNDWRALKRQNADEDA